MKAFTIFVGLITLLSFVLQFADLFPKYREQRIRFMVFGLGAFLGLSASWLSNVSVEIPIKNIFEVCLLMTFAVIGMAEVVLSIGIVTKRIEVNKHLTDIMCVGFCLMLIMLYFAFIQSFPNSK